MKRRSFGVLCVSASTVIAGCAGETSDDDPPEDRTLSRAEAAEYANDWVNTNTADRDQEALDHYETGIDAYSNENYSRAIRELELSTGLYEDLRDEAFDKRNTFDEDQTRWELFDMAWEMYRLLAEASASWYNAAFAIQVNDDPVEAAEWVDRAEEHDSDARRVAGEYGETLDTWQEDA